jgi:uroporphyrinogen decarboxylase
LALLRYQHYDRLPIVHFGYWRETLEKWAEEGHVSADEAREWRDGNPTDRRVSARLGFDLDWHSIFGPSVRLDPGFERTVVQEFADGSRHVLDRNGVVIQEKPGAGSIPAEVEHTLTDRESWEKHYKWRYQWKEERVTTAHVLVGDSYLRWDDGGLEFLQRDERDFLYGLFCGSLYGQIRDVVGLVGSAYLQVDDEELFDEIIDTVGDLCYRTTKYVLEAGARFDFAHFWEDIAFKTGPLVAPTVFREKVGPHYRRITDVVREHGIDIVSLDCDGKIDELIPIWLENGVNTMFPIEVGTWNASIEPWRAQYGSELRGVGGTNKTVFSKDRAAVEEEVDRVSRLVELGGYIPCPDHRIPPDAEWELVSYYCELLRERFS